LLLIAQQRVFGHAIPGIVEPDLGQYTHLGDAVSKRTVTSTTGRSELARRRPLGVHDGNHSLELWVSGRVLAAASRALRGYNDSLAEECLQTALRVWKFEKGRKPNLYRYG
jgi:hypothetical protein